MEFKESENQDSVEETAVAPEWCKTTADFTPEDYRRHLEETKDIKPIPTEYTQDFFNKFPVLIVSPHKETKPEGEEEVEEEGVASQSIEEREQREHIKRVILVDREGELQAGCETIDIGAQIRCYTRKTKRLD